MTRVFGGPGQEGLQTGGEIGRENKMAAICLSFRRRAEPESCESPTGSPTPFPSVFRREQAEDVHTAVRHCNRAVDSAVAQPFRGSARRKSADAARGIGSAEHSSADPSQQRSSGAIQLTGRAPSTVDSRECLISRN